MNVGALVESVVEQGGQKAVVIVVGAEHAHDLARLLAAAMSLNGYQHNAPAVIDWPQEPSTKAETAMVGLR